jgi:hypothetical protein
MSMKKGRLVAALVALLIVLGGGRWAGRVLASGSAEEDSVKLFMATVANDVTQNGPTTWLKYFESSPAFFMVAHGQLVFPNNAAAEEGTKSFAASIQHIELKWGEVRVDPLTENFVVVGAPWHEVWVNTAGQSTEMNGYFTGLVERKSGGWQFRNAHWSAVGK